jgi:iron complex outermembrane receptor protein
MIRTREKSRRELAAGRLNRLSAVGLCFLTIAGLTVLGEDASAVFGTVKTHDGSPAPDARVAIIELGLSGFTDERGAYRFELVPHGAYHLEASRAGLGSIVAEIDVSGETEVDLLLEFAAHREHITVTASRFGSGTIEAVQPVNVIDQIELQRKMQPTLGETLSAEPGVSSTYFGPGASRPVIRGLGGGRIRILEGGLGVGDASATSPDHAVSTDPVSAERVEILRGPATLLYGSTAAGGVVNVLDGRIPDHLPPGALTGVASFRHDSVSEGNSGAVGLDGRAGRIAWHADAHRRKTDDYEIPGRAVADDPDSASGELPNSDLEAEGGTLGASWVGDTGFVGGSVRRFTTNYGIPAEIEPDEGGLPGEEEEGGIRIDLEQTRYDLRGGFGLDSGRFDRVLFSAGGTDYEHRELEGAEIGTVFLNESVEARAELLYGTDGPRGGVLGIQYSRRDFEAIGEEAFVPPSVTDSAAVFLLQRLEQGSLSYELGARYELQDVEARGAATPSRDFDGLSVSAGLLWSYSAERSLGVSLARTARLPSAEELYSEGPHLATFSYERGDPTLSKETGTSLDVSLKTTGSRLSGELNGFLTRYEDFIFESPTGEIEDGLPVFLFTQSDAEFRGVELRGALHLLEEDGHHLDLELTGDLVRAELTDSGDPLPRIPPARAGLGVSYYGPRWEASVSLRRIEDQDRVTPSESPTEGYTMIDATLGYRLVSGDVVHHFLLSGTNLGDELARNHVSRLKDLVPLPGANVSLAYRLDF